jgi:tetratricopeptide (TPR) repeat protein
MLEKTCRRAIRLNNRGVRFLRKGLFEDASEIIVKGLELVKTAMRETEENDEQICSSDDHIISAGTSTDFAFLEAYSHSSSLDGECQSQEPSYHVFCSPIEILVNAVELMSPVHISIVQIFNLALAQHLSGIQNSSLERFEKALKLYELVHKIQFQEQVELSFLHTMALTNNLGHIHMCLKNTRRSKLCFEQLLTMLMYFVEGGEGEKVEHLEGFFLNVTSLVLRTSAAPAA